MWYPDLSQCTYWYRSQEDRIMAVAIGWLEGDHPYTTGSVPAEVIERLKDYAKECWQPVYFLGVHQCSLTTPAGLDSISASKICGRCGTLNIFIPYQGLIYTTPELIYHYITDHGYAPPAIFCEAVLNAPEPGSDAHLDALRAILPAQHHSKIDHFVKQRARMAAYSVQQSQAAASISVETV